MASRPQPRTPTRGLDLVWAWPGRLPPQGRSPSQTGLTSAWCSSWRRASQRPRAIAQNGLDALLSDQPPPLHRHTGLRGPSRIADRTPGRLQCRCHVAMRPNRNVRSLALPLYHTSLVKRCQRCPSSCTSAARFRFRWRIAYEDSRGGLCPGRRRCTGHPLALGCPGAYSRIRAWIRA